MALITTGRITITNTLQRACFFNCEETTFKNVHKGNYNEYFLEICTAINLGHYWDKI
jgi:hypothetical protein